MNAKMMAVMAAIVMVVSGTAMVLVSGDSDAEDGETVTVEPVIFNGSPKIGKLTLVVNEAEYGDYEKTVEWYAALNLSGTPASSTWSDNPLNGTAITIGTGTNAVSVTPGSVSGEYTFEFSDFSSDVADFGLKCVITVKATDNVNATSSSKVLTLYYKVPLKVTTTSGIENRVTFSDVTASLGKPYKKTISEDKGGNSVGMIGDVSNYNWYAVGLPDGLSMNANGTIEGIPTKVMTVDNVKITAFDKSDGHEITGTLKVTVSRAGLVDGQDSGQQYDYKVMVGSQQPIINPTQVMAIQGETVTMNIVKSDSTDYIVDSKVTVSIINQDGTRDSNLTRNSDQSWTLPTSGLGAYKVAMKLDGKTVYYSLLVISDIEDIRAGILVEGSA